MLDTILYRSHKKEAGKATARGEKKTRAPFHEKGGEISKRKELVHLPSVPVCKGKRSSKEGLPQRGGLDLGLKDVDGDDSDTRKRSSSLLDRLYYKCPSQWGGGGGGGGGGVVTGREQSARTTGDFDKAAFFSSVGKGACVGTWGSRPRCRKGSWYSEEKVPDAPQGT